MPYGPVTPEKARQLVDDLLALTRPVRWEALSAADQKFVLDVFSTYQPVAVAGGRA